MKPIYSNPENVTQEQLEPEKGWRFLLADEGPDGGDEIFNIGLTDWCASKPGFVKCGGWTYRTKRPLPIEYLTGENAEAFDDPAYQWSVRWYKDQQDKDIEFRIPSRKGHEWSPVERPNWSWDHGVIYRLAAEQPEPCTHRRVTVTEGQGRCNDCKADVAYSLTTRNWEAEQATRKEGDAEMPGSTGECDPRFKLTSAADVRAEGRAAKRMLCGGMSIKKMIRLLKAAKRGEQIQRKARLFQSIFPIESVWHDIDIEEAGFSVPSYDYRVKPTPSPIETAISRFTGKPFTE